jgi:predicted secreted protein
MDIVSSIVVFLIIWWVVLFGVLPLRISRNAPQVEGQDAGAPDHPHLWWKVRVTTIITVVIFGIIWTAVRFNLIDFIAWGQASG